MKKYFKNTKNMSLDEKISWVIKKVPHILFHNVNDVNIDIADLNNVLDNNGDTICILESEYGGNHAAKKATESAINLLNTDIVLLKSSDYILIISTIPPNWVPEEDNDPINEICIHVSDESSILWGYFYKLYFFRKPS